MPNPSLRCCPGRIVRVRVSNCSVHHPRQGEKERETNNGKSYKEDNGAEEEEEKKKEKKKKRKNKDGEEASTRQVLFYRLSKVSQSKAFG